MTIIWAWLTIAIITGFFTGLLVGMITRSLSYAVLAVLITALLMWIVFVWRWFWGLADLTERRKILEGPAQVNWQENEGKTIKLIDLQSVTIAQFDQIVNMIRNGGTLSIANLSRFFGGSRSEVQGFQMELVRRGYAVWRHSSDQKQGIALTPVGKKMIDDYLRARQSPHSR
jgi:hypothetical protein